MNAHPWGQLYELAAPRPAKRMGAKGRVVGIYANPWNLTPGEERMLQALATKRPHAVADSMDITISTLEEHTRSARRKMGVETTLLAVVAYDRWKRTEPSGSR